MVYHRQVTISKYIPAAALPILLMFIFSCRVPVDYQAHKPFVYKTTIKVEGEMPNDQRQDLIARLENQLDDSLQVKVATALRILPPFFYKKLSSPPVFDTANVSRSVAFMNALLYSMGYYTPVIKDSVEFSMKHHKQPSEKKRERKKRKNKKLKEHPDEHRATINFLVTPGKRLAFDSIGFDLETPALQALAVKSKNQSLLQKGNPYSKQILSNEISRLVDTFRNNGYYRFSREDLYMEHDTVIAALIDPTLDPFQQAALLEKLKSKREKPTINVVVKERPIQDSSHLTKYYIGKVTVYPDLPSAEDTSFVKTDTTIIRDISLITRSNKFRLPFIVNNIYLRPGRLYKQENYYRTSNRIGQLQAWQYNNIDFENSDVSDSLLDVTIRMYPAKKLKLTASLEASRNTNDIVTATNLFGIGVNFELQNRNSFKQSVQSITNLRGGIELGPRIIQSTTGSLSHTIAFPKLISPFTIKREGRLKNAQTLLNANASFTDRKLNDGSTFYTIRSINGSWGYQWTWSKQKSSGDQNINISKTILWKPVNVEYTKLDKSDSLDKILTANPSLNLAFRTGLVIGQLGAYTIVRQKGNKTNVFRVTAEESGAVLGFITSLDEGDLLRFIKGDVEFTHNIDFGKTQLALHTYAGAGIAYGRLGNGYEQTLPFYKAYFAGGPNTMRAWQVRQLGLGSSQFYNAPQYAGLDRFGDIKLEGNIEYRFLIGTIFGYKLRSALFTDIGNIWSRKPIDTTALAQGSDFQINRFYKEFAVGMGTGLRLDFNYFLIRLDWSYKVLDPQAVENPGKWFYNLRLADGQLQLGIGYPF